MLNFRRYASTSAIQRVYQRKHPREHVLLRPAMYVGSIGRDKRDMWILQNESNFTMKQQSCTYTPALLKIFDEILVNSADNRLRGHNMSKIAVKFEILEKSGVLRITVENDGKCIPIVFHDVEKMYIPELIFGHLMTGSNFDDATKTDKLTGGRHGYGAKLTNIFSSKFSVEILDKERGLRYEQHWHDNMKHSKPCKIEPVTGLESSTKVIFEPDLKLFNVDLKNVNLPGSDLDLMKKRVIDLTAVCDNVQVWLNGSRVPVSGFEEYVKLFPSNDDKTVFFNPSPRWHIGLTSSSSSDMEQISFANCIHTQLGGTHVTHIINQAVSHIESQVAKRVKATSISPSIIKQNLRVFVSALIENASFDSQSKDKLVTASSSFGSDCVLTPSILKQLCESTDIIDRVLDSIKAKDDVDMRRLTRLSKKSVMFDVPKLEDAHQAGSANRRLECSLILTEGDSAKALALAGIDVVGRDTYGVMPLRGKVLNVRGISKKKVIDNEEIMNMCKAMGLDFTKTYEDNLDGLRYGKVVLMTDQDADGAHIKGLLINLFDTFWPCLLSKHSVLHHFITPLVKAFIGDKVVGQFYSQADYDAWQKVHGSSKHHIKYYKGLGTSTAEEGREYFKDLPRHLIQFQSSNDRDRSQIDMAFNKDLAEKRKIWLLQLGSSSSPAKDASYSEFIDHDLAQFSKLDNQRSIPSAIDGLKPSQRKILFGCLKRGLTKEMKVAQLSGYIAEISAYHHGEVSLHSSIVNMAQDFVGSNNIPLLLAKGQFGTRNHGGEDAASPRYIFTQLSSLTRDIFPSSDDSLLSWLEDDGQSIEPAYYVPILPMLLVNGSQGIGTGWSSFIANHHPHQIIDHLLARLNGSTNKNDHEFNIRPWYRKFAGKIHPVTASLPTSSQSYLSVGIAKRMDKNNTIEISELPIGRWTQAYKEQLVKLIETGEIKSFQEHHSVDSVKFIVNVAKENLKSYKDNNDILSSFKLYSSINSSNMHAFDPSGKIKHYRTIAELMDEFFHIRMDLYVKRKKNMTDQLNIQLSEVQEKSRFVSSVIDESISIMKPIKSRDEIERLLSDKGWKRMTTGSSDTPSYDYLLNMPLSSFTSERVSRLQSDVTSMKSKLKDLSSVNEKEMWSSELVSLRDKIARSGLAK